jgi:hypothetical protein
MTTTIPAVMLGGGDDLNAWLSRQAVGGILTGDYEAEEPGVACDAPYGLTISSTGRTPLHPTIGAYAVRDCTIDLGGLVVRNTDSALFGPGVETRRRVGNRMLIVRGDVDGLTIRHATFADCSPAPRYATAREDWLGVVFSGAQNVTLDDVHTADTWSDGFYFTDHAGEPNRNVALTNCGVQRAGRQGITLNGVDGFTLDDACVVNNVARWAFDCEPQASGGAANVILRGFASAAQGLLNFNVPHLAPIGDWTLDHMTFPHQAPIVNGHLSDPATALVDRGKFFMGGCTHTDPTAPYAGHGPMVDVRGWSHADVVATTAYVARGHVAVSAAVVETGNLWVDPAAPIVGS